MGCECPRPLRSGNPRRPDCCDGCGRPINPDAPWVVNDATHNAFLDRFEEALRLRLGWPRFKPPPPEWLHFRHLCLSREQEGRERFGFAYLNRDNIQAGGEETSDAVNYTYFDLMAATWRGEAEEMDLVLEAAYHDYMGYLARLRLRARRHGAP